MGYSDRKPSTDAYRPSDTQALQQAAFEVVRKQLQFKVNRQAAERSEVPQPFTTVLNCRQPKSKRGVERNPGEEIRSERVPLFRVGEGSPQDTKRKRSADNGPDGDLVLEPESKDTCEPPTKRRLFATHRPTPKPKLLGKGRIRAAETYICDDVWHIIIGHLDPAQLFTFYKESAFFHRKLKEFTHLWKINRINHYGQEIPSPPQELTEFQYSDLLHGRSCQHCRSKANTRKAYWAFLRRWCTTCLHEQTIEMKDVWQRIRNVDGFPQQLLGTCLKTALSDSWGNYLGVNAGNASLHMSRPSSAVKVLYLRSELEALVEAFIESKDSIPPATSDPNEDEPPLAPAMKVFVEEKRAHVERLREFALNMEAWEVIKRTRKSTENKSRKDARREYFMEQALKLKLNPPVSRAEIERSSAFKSSIAISKWPNNSAWQSLRPKLEKDISESRKVNLPGGPSLQDAKAYDIENNETQSVPSAASARTLPAPQGLPSTVARAPVLPPQQPTISQLPPVKDPRPGPPQRLRTMEPPLTCRPLDPTVTASAQSPMQYQQHVAPYLTPSHDGTHQALQYVAPFHTSYTPVYQPLHHTGAYHTALQQFSPQISSQGSTGHQSATLQNQPYDATFLKSSQVASQPSQAAAGTSNSYPDRRLPPPVPAPSSLPSKTASSPGYGAAYENNATITAFAHPPNPSPGGFSHLAQYQHHAAPNAAQSNARPLHGLWSF